MQFCNSFRKSLTLFAAVALVLLVIRPASVFAYSGGSGTEADPYQIAAVSDWQQLINTPSDWDKYFIMTADLDLQGVALTPVGNGSTFFTGVFDGNGHIIRNAYINSPSGGYIGLFGYVGFGGQIRNVGVENANMTGGDYYVGGIVGWNAGNITNCHAAGAVSGYRNVGGLVGSNYQGTITDCYATGTVTESSYGSVGGLVGWNFRGTITNCYATVAVSGNGNVGGFLGSNSEGTITACYATGAVTGSSLYFCVGGLVGFSPSGTITACYATGAVSGNGSLGGIVGVNHQGTITACFWDIETSGQTGSDRGRGLTTSQMKSVIVYQNAGWADKGWVINDGLDYPHLAWENTGGTPIPQPHLPLLGSGTEQDPYQVWTTEDFALLSWYANVQDKHIALMTDLDLSGVVIYPIGGDLWLFRGVFEGNGHIISNADINMPGTDLIGLFGLNYHGQICNLGIENVNINGRSRVAGLVGLNDNGGTITNCYTTGSVSGYVGAGGLVGCNYNGSISNCHSTCAVSGNGYLGGLVGINITSGSIITQCYATGTVSGSSYWIGGLVGDNTYGSISYCYSTGAVSGKGCIGGLVGGNGSSISNCYSMGAVAGSEYIGGLVAYNGGNISDCYSMGSVSGSSRVGGLVGYEDYSGSVNNSFWDTQTSGQTTSAGGEGKTTAEMKMLSTFTLAGWDFTTPVWTINEGVDYPHLWWENTAPIADAGPGQTVYAWIDGIAEVTLDGSDSNDPDGDELTYLWTWSIDGDDYEANGVNPTIELPVGMHTIQLIVNDGLVDSLPDDVNITVIAPLQANLLVVPRVINRYSNQPRVRAIMYLPKDVNRADVNMAQPLQFYPGGIKSVCQYIIGYGKGENARLCIITLFDKSKLMSVIDQNGKVPVQVVGRLKTGRYFYGTDSIWIIKPPDAGKSGLQCASGRRF